MYIASQLLSKEKLTGRELLVEVEEDGNAGEASLVVVSSGVLFLVSMITMIFLIISMVIFVCGDHKSDSPHKKKDDLGHGGGRCGVGSSATAGTILTSNYGGNMVNEVGGGWGGGCGCGCGGGGGGGCGGGGGEVEVVVVKVEVAVEGNNLVEKRKHSWGR